MIAVGVTVAVILLPDRPAPVVASPVEPWPVSDLPKSVFRSGRVGFAAAVAFPLPLTPTADPLVFEYRPGHPPDRVPPTYRLHFDTAPTFPRPPVPVAGTVDRLDPDIVRRSNGVPGVVVLRGARVVP